LKRSERKAADNPWQDAAHWGIIFATQYADFVFVVKTTMRFLSARPILALFWLAACAGPAAAASVPCGGDFSTWLEAFKQEAVAQGVSQRTIQSALGGVTYDPAIIARDHAQGVFHQSFEQFSGRMVPPRLTRGERLLQKYGPVFSRIEQQYGVPGPVIVAIWGLETDFGANSGHFPTIRSLATLAFDCRRPDKFRGELLDALRIVDRGDMNPSDMRGAWAGEIGQTQFLPSSYLKYAVDYDGNGRRDLIRSVPDVLASTANYLKGYGWQRGQPWGQGTANFQVLLQWNASEVYTKTVAYFAERLAAGS
jgi:lytic murein transglycosylase